MSQCVPKYAWDRPPPGAGTGTLESIVNLATQKSLPDNADLVPCFAAPPTPLAKEALVPCGTSVDSCSGAATCDPAKKDGDEGSMLNKPTLGPRVLPLAGHWNKEQSVSVSGSGTLGTDSWHVPTVDTCEKELGGFGLTSTSFCSQGNNTLSSSGRPTATNNDDHDSVCHNRPQMDKASMLDEAIEYLKQLQAQVHVMSRMSVPPMMIPQLAMQQQRLQMSMMAAAAGMGMGMAPLPTMPTMDMNMGMNMNMNMNLNSMAACQNPIAALMPVAAPWDVASDARLPSQAVIPTDPISTYLTSQPQPMTIEAYSRMIALIQQQQQQLASVSKH